MPNPFRSASKLAPLALVLLTASCAKDEPKPAADVTPPAASAPSAEARAGAHADAQLTIEPKLGGSVFVAGQSQIELAIGADGRVDGLVYDAAGKPIAPDRVSEFSVTLNAQGDAKARVGLAWDAPALRFRGQADVSAGLVAKPIDVTLQVDGKAQSGVLEAYTLMPPSGSADAKLEANADAKLAAPKINAKGKLGADAKALADVKAPKIQAPNGAASLQGKAGASVAIPKPKADVSAKASAGADKKKSGAGASVKAKASFGFGN
ncbi:MAG TPA: hypothetical protein VMG12_10840 [Polyangiaceae bacterium]|nr:hypothetical protein [Polyangiaceae bacterium]